MVEIIVPTPGESITEVEIGSWLVENGSWVDLDQEIVSIESEKATLEVTSPAEGILEIISQPGEAVNVGAVIGKILPGERPESAAPKAAEKKTDEPAETSAIAAPFNEAKPLTETQSDEDRLSKVKITPVARKLMEENNLNIDDVINGIKRLGKKEIQQIIDNQSNSFSGAATNLTTERLAERSRMSLLRRKLSERLVAVKNTTAMLTTFNEIDMSAVMDLRNEVKNSFAEKHGVKLGFMSFFSLAAARSLMAFPRINSMIDGEEIVEFNYADIGIAVQTPKGLMVPVIRDVQAKGLAQIEMSIADIAAKARNNKISIDELEGGTFSITNGGVFGSLLSTPILNPPQSAILGMHNIVERPVAVKGQVVVKPMMYVALSYDHRIVDGKDSVSFLKNIKDLIENPYLLLDKSGEAKKRLFDL
jgi:2-oxoglutarate dehydrogenase E2 component (dihydrolipoamide succinyltransferase)